MSSAAPLLDRLPTRGDLDAIPTHIKAEIIDGVLYTQPRPRPRHSFASSSLLGDLMGPFSSGRGGPGGWWILSEPGIELANAPEVSPDLAGWRRERMPAFDPDAPIHVVPDWLCEVLSPSNHAYDRKVKLPFYARIGVSWLWLIDPRRRTVEVKERRDGRWTEVATFADDDQLCAEPFRGVTISLASLWLPGPEPEA